GRRLDYDALSFNVGSTVDSGLFDATGAEAQIWPVKPVSRLWPLQQALRDNMAAGASSQIVIIGGGASGCEIAAHIAMLVAGSRCRVLLITRSARLWPDAPALVSRRLIRTLAARGAEIIFDTAITG